MEDKEKEWIALDAAARAIGVPVPTLRRWVDQEKLPLRRSRKGSSMRRAQLRKLLEGRGMPVPHEVEPGPRVLVVDDEPDLLRLVAWMLKAMWPGSTVKTAGDGRRALAKLLEFEPDLLVTDIRMPGRSGIDLCRLIREHRELSHTKILAMTAYDSPRVGREALESGADEYLAKPFSADELKRSTTRLLGPDEPERERRYRPTWPSEVRK